MRGTSKPPHVVRTRSYTRDLYVRRSEVEIRVIAAVFRSVAAADDIASELTRRYGLGPGQLQIADFGTLGPDEDEPSVIPREASIILGGRLDEDVVGAAQELIKMRGGVIVSDVDESRTATVPPPA